MVDLNYQVEVAHEVETEKKLPQGKKLENKRIQNRKVQNLLVSIWVKFALISHKRKNWHFALTCSEAATKGAVA